MQHLEVADVIEPDGIVWHTHAIVNGAIDVDAACHWHARVIDIDAALYRDIDVAAALKAGGHNLHSVLDHTATASFPAGVMPL